MKIDLDAVLAVVEPAPIELVLDKAKYRLKEMLVGEILLLEGLARMRDDEAIDLIEGLFSGKAPPFLTELRKASARLAEVRAIVADRDPKLCNRKGPSGDVLPITSVDASNTFGGTLPATIADFREVESRYFKLNRRCGILTTAITTAVAETTPGNVMAAAIKEISRQVNEQASASSSG